MFVVFYFMLIRPQQKRAKEHASLLDSLKTGDQVVTRGGLIGKVTGVQDKIVTVEVQEKVRIRVLKSYIESKFSDAQAVKAVKKEAVKPEPNPSESKT
ncbi:MAG: preprotein translocase subunit YajC [Deltaproteobacteria bacterium]|nr:preprotein translocase subunit YajC [Deltaproteobacteria bacterium]